MRRLPGRHARATRRASRCASSCRAARPGSRGRRFYTQWDREVGAHPHRARALPAGHPARRRRAELVGLRHRTTARSSFDEALHRWLNCVVLTTGTGNVTSSRAPGRAGASSTARRRSSRPATTCCASPTSRARWATTRRTTSSSARCPNIGDRELLEATFGVPSASTRTASTRCSGSSVECPAHDGLHIFEDAFVVQIVDPETGEPLPDGELGSIVRHRALQDRQPAVPLQHHGPVVPVPARAVRVRELAAQDGAVRGPRRQHGEAARRERVARGGRRGRARRSPASSPTTSCARVRDGNRDEMIVLGRERRATPSSSPRCAAAVESAAQGAARRADHASRSSRPARSTRGPRSERAPKLKRFRDER